MAVLTGEIGREYASYRAYFPVGLGFTESGFSLGVVHCPHCAAAAQLAAAQKFCVCRKLTWQ